MKLLVGSKEVIAQTMHNNDGSLELLFAPVDQAAGHTQTGVQDQQQRPYLVGAEHPSAAPKKINGQHITIPVTALKELAEECCVALSAITGLDVCIAYREPVSSDQPETITGGSHERKTIYYRSN